jgi:hypothetical protein
VDQLTLKYLDSSSILHSQTFNVLSVKGFDDPDKVQLVPPYQPVMVDGSIQDYIKGFRRIITADLGVVASSVDRRTIQSFLRAQTKSIVYQGSQVLAEEVFVNLQDVSGYQNEWKWDFEGARYFVLQILENQIRTVWPVSFLPSDNMTGYIIYHVKIEGTQASPETFQTNSGKLQYNFGTTPFPVMNLTTYNITVIANGAKYQDANINQVGTTAQAGNNISFQLSVSDLGNPSGDGYYYADIVFLLQALS